MEPLKLQLEAKHLQKTAGLKINKLSPNLMVFKKKNYSILANSEVLNGARGSLNMHCNCN